MSLLRNKNRKWEGWLSATHCGNKTDFLNIRLIFLTALGGLFTSHVLLSTVKQAAKTFSFHIFGDSLGTWGYPHRQAHCTEVNSESFTEEYALSLGDTAHNRLWKQCAAPRPKFLGQGSFASESSKHVRRVFMSLASECS